MKLGKGLLHVSLLVLLALGFAPTVIGCSSSCSDHRVSQSQANEADQLLNEVALPSYKVITGRGSGSAVAFRSRFLLTAAHVVLSDTNEPLPDIKVYSKLGRHKVIADAVVVKFDYKRDLAVLKVNVAMPYIAQLVSKEDILTSVKWGSNVVASGYALGVDDPVVTEGRISSVDNEGFIQYTCSTVFGNSGGPVYTKCNGEYKVFSICQLVFMAYGPVCHMGLGVNSWTMLDFVKGY